MCCDCGLVHNMNFRLIKNNRGTTVQFHVERNYRATAAARRGIAAIKFVRKEI